MPMQGFPTAQALADALVNGTLSICNPAEWTSLNYNDNVSSVLWLQLCLFVPLITCPFPLHLHPLLCTAWYMTDTGLALPSCSKVMHPILFCASKQDCSCLTEQAGVAVTELLLCADAVVG